MQHKMAIICFSIVVFMLQEIDENGGRRSTPTSRKQSKNQIFSRDKVVLLRWVDGRILRFFVKGTSLVCFGDSRKQEEEKGFVVPESVCERKWGKKKRK